jgi:hypothetical protein
MKETEINISYDALIKDEKDIIESYRELSEQGKQKFQQFFKVVKDEK